MPYFHVLTPDAPLAYPGVQLDNRWNVYTFLGDELPKGLVEYASPPHSWERYVESRINFANTLPGKGETAVRLRAYQEDQVSRIQQARDAGAPGYLLNFPVGSGKTLISVAAIDQMDVDTVLVVAKLDTIPSWRASIDAFTTGSKRWVVINVEQLWRTFTHAETPLASYRGNRSRLALSEGVSLCQWGAVVVDEAQILADPCSQRSRLMRHVSKDFTVFATATPFSQPSESAYVAPLLANAARQPAPEDVESDFVPWLRELGFRLKGDESGRWSHVYNAHDVDLVGALLYDAGLAATATVEELSLPVQNRSLRAIALTPEQKVSYGKAWLDFLAERGLSTAGQQDPHMRPTEALREVQRASFLKLPGVAELIADYVALGYQVAVPMFFLNSVDELVTLTRKACKARGLDFGVVTMTGRSREAREAQRLKFQTGRSNIAIFNGVEGINLHASESNVDGRGGRGSDAPRVCIIADVLTGGKRLIQAEGRTQRDGQESEVVYVYAEGTEEQRWLSKMFARVADTERLSRRDSESYMELSRLVDI